ncbi:MAG TPA: FHA domain-containing protein [Myxococcota bacterium]|jgi:pSer/pThr/pTyr-binding forkhead associated (FHA) protein
MELPALSKAPIAATRAAIADVLRKRSPAQGYFHAECGSSDAFLFFRDGRAWCAGESSSVQRDSDVPMASSVARFLELLPRASRMFLCDVDLPLFLCAAVVFRKPPALHVPTSLIDSDQLLKNISAFGKDVVLSLHTKGSWALAFCRAGAPTNLYASAALMTPPSAAAVTERVLEVAYAYRDVVIDLYDEIRLPQAADAGQGADELEGVLVEARRPLLLVMLGDRVVFRHRVDRAETLVGRGLDVQLALDNLSISRHHALIKVAGDRVIVEDKGSENGVVYRGARVPSAALAPGERVELGKYSLVYAIHADVVDEPAPRARGSTADIETVNIEPRKDAALDHRGAGHRIKSAITTIGSAPDASLRIRGLFIARIHAVIEPDPISGGYALMRVGKTRAVRVNGRAIKRHVLKDGDEIVLAGERVRFVLP